MQYEKDSKTIAMVIYWIGIVIPFIYLICIGNSIFVSLGYMIVPIALSFTFLMLSFKKNKLAGLMLIGYFFNLFSIAGDSLMSDYQKTHSYNRFVSFSISFALNAVLLISVVYAMYRQKKIIELAEKENDNNEVN